MTSLFFLKSGGTIFPIFCNSLLSSCVSSLNAGIGTLTANLYMKHIHSLEERSEVESQVIITGYASKIFWQARWCFGFRHLKKV